MTAACPPGSSQFPFSVGHGGPTLQPRCRASPCFSVGLALVGEEWETGDHLQLAIGEDREVREGHPAAGVEDGYELIPESLQFEGGEVEGVDGQGRVTFEMYGEGMTAANLVLDDILTDIAGQKVGVAATYMYENLPLQDYPSVHVWPGWFGRLPFVPVRIQTQIEFGS